MIVDVPMYLVLAHAEDVHHASFLRYAVGAVSRTHVARLASGIYLLTQGHFARIGDLITWQLLGQC